MFAPSNLLRTDILSLFQPPVLSSAVRSVVRGGKSLTARSAPSTPQSSTQEIGEEAEEDAIFTITLRKMQLHQSASKGQRWLGVETDSALSLYETCKVRTIKAGTLERLVEYMVSAFRGKDSTYVTIFLCTYRSFATTKQVLDLLLNRFGDTTQHTSFPISNIYKKFLSSKMVKESNADFEQRTLSIIRFLLLLNKTQDFLKTFFRYARLPNVPAATAHRVSQDDCTELRK